MCVCVCRAWQLLRLCIQPEPRVYTELALPLSEMTRTTSGDKASSPACLTAASHSRVSSTGGQRRAEGNQSGSPALHPENTSYQQFELRGRRSGRAHHSRSTSVSRMRFCLFFCDDSLRRFHHVYQAEGTVPSQ